MEQTDMEEVFGAVRGSQGCLFSLRSECAGAVEDCEL